MNVKQTSSIFCVIMPFGSDEKSGQKIEIIKSVAEKYGFVARFPRYENTEFDIVNTIQDFRKASFVVADLSFERPSCYFELGIAEAIDTDVFIFAIDGTDIHQTSYRDKVQFYKTFEHFQLLLDRTFHNI